jgi:hypothetical protein
MRRANPIPKWRGYATTFQACRHIPGNLERKSEMTADDRSMFAVANGLAIERMKWPIVFEPHEIEPLTSPEPEAKGPNWWEEERRPRWT